MKHVIVVLVMLISLTGMAIAVPSTFSETWEGYTNGATPYGSWELQAGAWGGISTPGYDSNQCYSVAQGNTARIRKAVNLDDQTHIVLQGWLKDSGGANSSMLGLAGDNTADNNSMIRIGANSASNYQVQYYEGLGSGLITVDTGLAAEAGWHFTRLDLEDTGFVGIWNVTWRMWNTAKTVERTGQFGWFFNKTDANYVTLGSPNATAGAVAWDDIEVGSLDDVGPPPVVPEPSSLLALGSGLAGMAAFIRRRR